MKRYLTYVELAYELKTSYPRVRDVIKAFHISHVKCNGRQCVRREDSEYLKDCLRLLEASRMSYKYVETLPKKIIKDLIERL